MAQINKKIEVRNYVQCVMGNESFSYSINFKI